MIFVACRRRAMPWLELAIIARDRPRLAAERAKNRAAGRHGCPTMPCVSPADTPGNCATGRTVHTYQAEAKKTTFHDRSPWMFPATKHESVHRDLCSAEALLLPLSNVTSATFQAALHGLAVGGGGGVQMARASHLIGLSLYSQLTKQSASGWGR